MANHDVEMEELAEELCDIFLEGDPEIPFCKTFPLKDGDEVLIIAILQSTIDASDSGATKASSKPSRPGNRAQVANTCPRCGRPMQ